jgi:hypothetical protein
VASEVGQAKLYNYALEWFALLVYACDAIAHLPLALGRWRIGGGFGAGLGGGGHGSNLRLLGGGGGGGG